MKKISSVLNKIILWTLIVLGMLFLIILNILFHQENMSYDLFYYIYTVKTPDPLFVSVLSVGFAFVAVLLCWLLNKVIDNLSFKKLLLILVVIQIPTFVYGVFWVIKNPYIAMYDSRRLVQLAQMVVDGADSSKFYDYFNMLPQQRTSVLYFILITKLFPHNAYFAVRLLNVFFVAIIGVVLSLIAYETSKKAHVAIITSIFLVLFFPLIWYSNHAYGTIPGMTFVFISFYSVIKYVDKGKTRYAVATLISLLLAFVIYKGTLIAHIAVIVFLFCAFLKEKERRNILLALLIGTEIVLASVAATPLFTAVTGMHVTGGVPSLAWIEMGLTSRDGENGAGSYNFLIDRYYEYFGDDTSGMKKQIRTGISSAIKDAVENPEETVFFFREKTKWAWTDATFGGIKESLSQWTDYDNPDFFAEFRFRVAAKPMEIAIEFLTIFVSAIYLINLWAFVRMLIRGSDLTGSSPKTLLLLYFVGGFTYQLLGEQKSRYCLPYFIVLIVLAAVEVSYCLYLKNEET